MNNTLPTPTERSRTASKEIQQALEIWKVLYSEVAEQLHLSYPIAGLLDLAREDTFDTLCVTLDSCRTKLLSGAYAPNLRTDMYYHPTKEDVEDFRLLSQLFSFLRKNKCHLRDTKTAALEKYLDFERNHNFDKGISSPYVEELKWIITDWLRPLEEICQDAPLPTGHGPGVTFLTSKEKLEKYNQLVCHIDQYTEELYWYGSFPFEKILQQSDVPVVLGTPSDSDVKIVDARFEGQGERYEKTHHDLKIHMPNRISRPTTVFKTWKIDRVIGPEDVFIVWAAQGFRIMFYRFLKNHPYLRYRLDPTNQEQNQILSRLGSYTCSYASIDLSSASDSVPSWLINYLLEDLPHLRAVVMTLRSTWILVPTENTGHWQEESWKVAPSAKMAGMGWPLTFWTEMMVFGGCAELACRIIKRLNRLKTTPRWSVFGDDITIDAQCFKLCCDILESLGFTVNKDKSFNGIFTESCGSENYYGSFVTPVLYKIGDGGSRFLTAETYGSYLALVNGLHWQGLPKTRRFVMEILYNKRVKVKKDKQTKKLISIPLTPIYTDDPADTSKIFVPYLEPNKNKTRVQKDENGNCTWIKQVYGTHVVSKTSHSKRRPVIKNKQPVLDWLAGHAWDEYCKREPRLQENFQDSMFKKAEGRLVTGWCDLIN
jgi:hypothetical protein